MHYYKFHIGDYRRKAASLSILEHGIYRQLIDEYHLTEAPLTNDFEMLCWSIGARTKEEQDAVTRILNFFFKNTKKGWFHSTCEEQVGEYKAKALKNKENGRKGGRPKKNPEKTQSVSKQNPEETLTNNHKPLTNNHKPNDKPAPNGLAKFNFKSVLIDLGVSEQLASEFMSIRRMKKAKDTETAMKGLLREVKKSGLTLDQAITHCVEHSWKGFKAEWVAVNTNTNKTGQEVGFIEKHTDKSWRDGL